MITFLFPIAKREMSRQTTNRVKCLEIGRNMLDIFWHRFRWEVHITWNWVAFCLARLSRFIFLGNIYFKFSVSQKEKSFYLFWFHVRSNVHRIWYTGRLHKCQCKHKDIRISILLYAECNIQFFEEAHTKENFLNTDTLREINISTSI